MTLAPGSRLGPYEIVAPLGAGGMGEVYRARDTKLNRNVALKILPEAFASDSDRLARFTREAQTLAALNHPHIAQVYGFEDSGGVRALVMELVEGDDLSVLIARGPMPLAEALPVAGQIAEALEAAHEQGVIHRDLKPANIKVREDGSVKVLDFGLAKLADPPAASGGVGVSQSPTITTPAMMTRVGVILGTAAYMSPEQAKGRAADKRGDVWAFGCVLFEMLTGKRAFEGEDVSDTLAAVLRGEPDWNALPPDLPSHLRTIVRRCLEKDRKRRFADTSVVQFLLNEPSEATTLVTQPVASPRPLWRRALPLAMSAVVAAAITVAVAWKLWPSAPALIVTRFAVPLGDGQALTNPGRQLVAVSPDGTRLVYVANRRLYLRPMSESEARPIAGTESAESVATTSPVFSPDGRSVAFFTAGALRRIAINGGVAVTICPAANPFGMSWDHDEILFGQGEQGIMRVSANGGTPERLVAVKSGELAHGPQLLPGGQAVLFTLATGTAGQTETWDKAQIVVQSLKSGERKTLVSGGADARYVPTGHLVYALGGVVLALRFDPRRLAVIGGPVPIIEGVARAGTSQTGVAHFFFSDNGSLVFIRGPASTSTVQADVAFMDRQGSVQPLRLPPGPYQHPRASPDGTRLAVGTDDGKAATVWIYDLSATSARRQLTFGGRNRFPIWSADSQRVAFQSDREGDLALFWQRADGAGTAERLTRPEKGTSHVPESWAPDGNTVLVTVSKGSSFSLWAFSMPSKQVAAYGGVEAESPISATFSSDGRWVAYTHGTVGKIDLQVQPFPATGAKYQVSSRASHPFWSTDGHELFFHTPGRYARVSIGTKPTFTMSNPVDLPGTSLLDRGTDFERDIDILPDGNRFVGVIAADQVQSGITSTQQIQVVENWFEELKARVPTK